MTQTTFEQGLDSVAELVKRFSRNAAIYRGSTYNEAQARIEFINPFFEALGWDVHNRAGYAPQYRHVDYEYSVEVEGVKKKPDYAFKVSSKDIKFFAEAKKPGVNLKTNAEAAYQVRTYGWNVKLPVSLLTDFEELAVYNCRARPSHTDKPSVGLVQYFHFEEYADRWRDVWDEFSYEAVTSGKFDQFAQSKKGERGTSPVDAEFLKEIEGWRDVLARNMALRNPRLSVDELNDAVQRTIDRIIFFRMAEDRDIEPYEQLQRLAKRQDIYAELIDLCRKADGKYNSGLFDLKADTLTPRLVVDDKVLAPILHDLYFPQSPYRFNLLPTAILGNVYEQFLGKVIRLTAGHQAKVEEKPEVKKAGGVYYTPAYIVEYIVKNTVGKWIADHVGARSPRPGRGDPAPTFRILDPACGSGSFLLGAYQCLLDYYLQWYTEQNARGAGKKQDGKVYQAKDGSWQLTTAEKKRILTTHIFGVDIDRQAVEVTKLSLLLKVLEGESDETLGQQLALFAERALPNLDNNVKCGNSLIGPDYFTGQLLPDPDELRRVNPFDWEHEFPDAMRAGGFDCVIGNPPYGATLLNSEFDYLRAHFKDESRSYDTYELFLLQATRLLTQDGRLSMIIPASWLTGEKYHRSRQVLLNVLSPVVAYAMPFDVFKDAYIDTAVIVFTRSSEESCLVHYFPKKEKLTAIPDGVGTFVPTASIRSDHLNRLSMVLAQESAPMLAKLKNAPLTFGDWFDIHRGVQPYSRKKHTEEQITQRFLHAKSKRSKAYLPELQGNELSRYWIEPERVSYLRYCDEIASIRPLRTFQGERIVLRRLLTRKFRLQASMTTETMITTDNVLNIVPRLPQASVALALGLLNSKLLSWLYVNTSMIAQKDDFPQVHISALAVLPIPNCDQTSHDRMVSLIEQMLELHKRLAAASASDRELYQRQIDATDREIDKLVYELYGLTEEEIGVVERSGLPSAQRING